MTRVLRLATATWIVVVLAWLVVTLVGYLTESGSIWPVLVTGLAILPAAIAAAILARRIP